MKNYKQTAHRILSIIQDDIDVLNHEANPYEECRQLAVVLDRHGYVNQEITNVFSLCLSKMHEEEYHSLIESHRDLMYKIIVRHTDDDKYELRIDGDWFLF